MARSYLFYDIETTGLNKAFDQVLEFAAIRTDEGFNPLEHHTISVELRPDIIPSPRAILTNRISAWAYRGGLCEYEASTRIHRLMNQPGTISLGYNTLGFDDEFLRFAFHRNLLPPYTHQFKDGCGRMDLFPVAVLYWLYNNEVINWPQIDGTPSLKLEHIGSANHLASGRAHEAMEDVATTVELARRFSQKKKMWRYILGYFDKATDAHRLNQLPIAFRSGAGDHYQAVMVAGEFGSARRYQVPVISMGQSIPYSNQTLWLRMDLPDLRRTRSDAPSETSWVFRKRMGEPGILLPPKKRYWKRIDDKRRAEYEKNLAWLQENPDTFHEIISYYREFRYPFIPALDPDASLYQIGFYSRSDENRCRWFHRAPLDEKAEIASQFASPDARRLGRRILRRNYPDAAPGEPQNGDDAYMQRINPLRQADAMVDYRGERRTTPASARDEIAELKSAGGLDEHQHRLLDDLEGYIRSKFNYQD